jgi:hypothetical protein
MRPSRFTEEQIIGILKEQEVSGCGESIPIKTLVCRHSANAGGPIT